MIYKLTVWTDDHRGTAKLRRAYLAHAWDRWHDREWHELRRSKRRR